MNHETAPAGRQASEPARRNIVTRIITRFRPDRKPQCSINELWSLTADLIALLAEYSEQQRKFQSDLDCMIQQFGEIETRLWPMGREACDE